jgi:predicted transcriptional regulator
MMVQERWWVEFRRRLENGKIGHSFVLRGAAPPKNTQMILFYVTAPVQELAGYASFVERKCGEPHEMWRMHGGESVLKSREEYEKFIGDVQQVSLVRFRDLHVTVNPISLKTLLMSLGVKRLSRKGFYVGKETAQRLISMME